MTTQTKKEPSQKQFIIGAVILVVGIVAFSFCHSKTQAADELYRVAVENNFSAVHAIGESSKWGTLRAASAGITLGGAVFLSVISISLLKKRTTPEP